MLDKRFSVNDNSWEMEPVSPVQIIYEVCKLTY